jgi:4-hydroxy-tetrahydrodipicolinate reductase
MIRVVQIGLGPLGQMVVRFALQRKTIRIVAAVDKDPAKIGRDLGVLCGVRKQGVRVCGNLRTALRGRKADVAVLTTVSALKRIEQQVAEIAAAGLHIVSTCEEMSFPWIRRSMAKRMDAACRRHGVACVGTGVNPGFLMDYLPIVLTSVCQSVKKVTVWRVQNASSRRIPFQQKIGAGLTRRQFADQVALGSVRHVGLTESMNMIAAALDWRLDRTTEVLRPVIASRRIASGYRPIPKGYCCGVSQTGRGFRRGREVIRLNFRAAVGEKASYDTVAIRGVPDLCSVIPGGVNGDTATCAIVLNAARVIGRCSPGLRTMLDLPAPSCG